MSFFIEFLKHPRRIAAVAPSSASLSAKIMKNHDSVWTEGGKDGGRKESHQKKTTESIYEEY